MNLLNIFLSLASIYYGNIPRESCDFDCWIRSLVINVPTESLGDLGVPCNITNLTISNISISKIDGYYYPDKSQIEDGLGFDIDISATIKGDVQIPLFDTKLNFTAMATNVDADLALQFVKDSDGLISAVSIYNDDACKIQINDFDIQIKFDSSAEQWIYDLVKGLIDKIIKDYAGGWICSGIKSPIAESGSAIFEYIGDAIRPYINGTTPIDIPIDSDEMSDLQSNQLIDLLRFVLTNLTSSDGPLNLNRLFNKFSKDTGVFDYQSIAELFGLPPTLQFDIPIENDNMNATIGFTLENLILSGLNTWNDFTIFDPISPFIVDTHTGLQQFEINASFGLNISASGMVESGNVDLTETAILHLYLENSTLDARFQIAHEKDYGLNFTSMQIIDPNCLISLFSPYGTGMTMLELNTTIKELQMEAASGSLEESIQHTLNTMMQFFIYNYKRQIPVFITSFIQEYGTSYINNQITEVLSSNFCEYIPEPDYCDYNLLVSMIAVGITVVGTSVILILLATVHYMRKKRLERASVTNQSTSGNLEQVSGSVTDESSSRERSNPVIEDDYSDSKFLSFFRSDEDASLLMHPRLPLWVRIIIPFLIFGNITVFLSANSGYGGSVFPEIVLGDTRKIEFFSVADWGLISSIRDMWKAGTYALSLIVACMSCVWPYTKLILMIITWILPATILPKRNRERILRLLDMLGKWSILDSFFMIMMVVSFHFIIQFPIVNPDKVPSANSLNIWVYPAYGFIGLIGGTIYSLAMSHIMCALDMYATKPLNDPPNANRKICVFKEQHLATKIILAIFLPIQFALFVYGITCNSFSFEFVGLTGWALDLLDIPNINHYTIIQLGIEFINCCQQPNSFNNRLIQVIYFITAVVTPMLHIMAMAVMLLVPMTKKRIEFWYNACEYLYAWSCLDVLTLSILISIFQITRFTLFIIGHNCDAINAILARFFGDEKYIQGHEKCFEVLTVLEQGSIILIATAVINTIAAIWINYITRKALAKFDEEEGNYVPVADSPVQLISTDHYTE